MIYFARTDPDEHPEVDYIKIGFTAGDDARKRISQLQTSSPFKIDLIATIAGADTQHESALHALFSEDRAMGEWFYVTNQILTYIVHFATVYEDIAPAKVRLPTEDELRVETRVKEMMEGDRLIYKTLMELCVQSTPRWVIGLDKENVYKKAADRVANAVLTLKLAGLLNIGSHSMEYNNDLTWRKAKVGRLP